jgi:site-specific recombinase XerD
MNPQKQTIHELTDKFYFYLKKHRSRTTLEAYQKVWKNVMNYMSLHRIKFYSSKIGEKFLVSKFGQFNFDQLPLHQRNFASRVEALADFQNTGTIVMGTRRKPPKVFTGFIGKTILNFITSRQKAFGLRKATITNYTIYLHQFSCFLKIKGITSIGKISKNEILSFITQIDPAKPAARHVAITVLKKFANYLYEQQFVDVDYSRSIPNDNYKNQPHLPSTFSEQEIGIFIKAIDRGSPKGKRDYAIFLLAMKLGMRSSDIRNLKFENINWEANNVSFDQHKTGKHITLPLLPEIGNAIIDYIKHGRPVSKESNCFLQVISPYKTLGYNDIINLVDFYLKRARICFKNKKHGPHALRHSYAANLLKSKTPLPIISEALGHTSTSSTMLYLRIDVESLKQCALDVPLLSTSFYNQKGGYYA